MYPKLFDLDQEALAALLPGEPAYRVRQVWEGLYQQARLPEELTNLGMRSEHRALVERLRGVMRDELRRTGANFIEALPATANR